MTKAERKRCKITVVDWGLSEYLTLGIAFYAKCCNFDVSLWISDATEWGKNKFKK